jgi:uncharacterized protein (DUF2461 family)
MPFTGFSGSTILFLAELSQNNDRTWFEAHREDCDRALAEPARAFVEALIYRQHVLDDERRGRGDRR